MSRENQVAPRVDPAPDEPVAMVRFLRPHLGGSYRPGDICAFPRIEALRLIFEEEAVAEGWAATTEEVAQGRAQAFFVRGHANDPAVVFPREIEGVTPFVLNPPTTVE